MLYPTLGMDRTIAWIKPMLRTFSRLSQLSLMPPMNSMTKEATHPRTHPPHDLAVCHPLA